MNDRDNPSHEEIRKRIEELSARIDSLQGDLSKTRDDLIGLRILLVQPSEKPPEKAPATPPTPRPTHTPTKPPERLKPEEAFWAQPTVHLEPKKPETKEKIGKSISPELGAGYPNYDHLFDDPSPEKETLPPAASKQAPPDSSLPLPRFTASAKDSEADEMDLETKIGAVWFNRIGLVILVIGVSLLARVVHPQLEPWHKVLIAYAFGFALFGVGKYFEERLQAFARPVMAGGMSVVFFTSFAGHFVEAMQCLDRWHSLLLMSVSVGWIVMMAERWKSEPTAGLAIFLGHVAAFTAAGSADAFSLVAILFLGVTGCALFLRHDWAPLNLFSVVASFASHMLWAVQDHPVSTPQIQFWVNFGFLSSYYTIFTFSDAVFRTRVFESGLGRYTPLQIRAARAVGPAALVLYATLSGFFFEVTDIYWERIHWFWLPLAALQVGLTWFHREKRNPDYPVYGTAATIFLTLGLASALGGFSLNLALAAEALMLLVLAQRLRLWFLNPLAQIVLAINFIHYWKSDAHEIATWPVFIGSLATACVYFVKSRIEETWKAGIRDERVAESHWVAELREDFDKLTRPLSYLHALGGSILLVYQCGRFLEGFHSPLAAAVLSTILLLATLFFRSRPYVPAYWALSFGVILLIAAQGTHLHSPRAAFIGSLSSAHLLTAASAVALWASRWVRTRLFLVMGFWGILIGALAYCVSLFVGDPSPWLLFWGLVTPLLLWIGVDRERHGVGGEHIHSNASFLEGLSRPLSPAMVQGALSIAAGVVTVAAAHRILDLASTEILFLTLVSLLLLAVSLIRDAPLYGLGIFILVVFGLSELAPVLVRAETSHQWVWWSHACALLVAIGALVGGMGRGRVSFLWLGAATLAALEVGLFEVSQTGAGGDPKYAPYPLWIATILGIWVAVELFRETLAGSDGESFRHWADRPGIAILTKAAPILGVLFSLGAAFLLYRFSVGHFDHKTDAAWAVGIYATVLLAGAGLLGSYTLGVGGLATLTLAHSCIYFFNGVKYVGTHHPFLMVFLTVVPLAAGGLLEAATWKNRRFHSKPRFQVAIAASVYFYLLAFLLARHLVEWQVAPLFELATAYYPAWLLLTLLVLVVAWRFQLSWLQIVTLAFALKATFIFLLQVFDVFILEPGGVYAAGLMGSILIAMERLLQRQPREILDRVRPRTAWFVHSFLPPLAAVVFILSARFSDELRLSWMTFTYSLVGITFMGLGFLWRDRVYRRTALAVFILCIARVVLIDIMNLELFYRMLAFICLGLCLLAVSWLYTRFQKQVHDWI